MRTIKESHQKISTGKRKILAGVVFLAVMLVCSVGNTVHAAKLPSVKRINVKIGNQTVTKKTYKIKKGKSKQLKISISPKKAVKSIKMKSGNKKVATVSPAGKVTAKKVGNARITITVTGKDKKKKSTWVNVRVVAGSYSQDKEQTTTEDDTDVTEEDTMYQIELSVNGKIFPAKLYKNKTTEALMKKLPLTLNMSELNGNEKYYYLSDSLPTDAKKPSKINTGDIMLYGNDCLVLFYKSFSTSYSYTSLGYVEDVEGLAEALGSGSVKVTFQ